VRVLCWSSAALRWRLPVGAGNWSLVARLPEDLQIPVRVAAPTGWRMRSELLTRQWRHVDLKAGWLRLEPGEGKTREGRQFPLTTELRELLESQRARTAELEGRLGMVIPWVFHRNGAPTRRFHKEWVEACKAAGLPGRLVHDLRRTAARNMERDGVPRGAATRMVGHKTESIYRRYAIVDEAMLKEAATKMARRRRG
jgi:integrase